MTHKEALTLALEALKHIKRIRDCQREIGYPLSVADKHINTAIEAAEEALAQPEQEPVGWMCHPFADDECEFSDHQECENCIPLYTTPPQRTWVGLTDEEIEEIFNKSAGYGRDDFRSFARAIEAAHGIKEKNT